MGSPGNADTLIAMQRKLEEMMSALAAQKTSDSADSAAEEEEGAHAARGAMEEEEEEEKEEEEEEEAEEESESEADEDHGAVALEGPAPFVWPQTANPGLRSQPPHAPVQIGPGRPARLGMRSKLLRTRPLLVRDLKRDTPRAQGVLGLPFRQEESPLWCTGHGIY